MADAEARNMQYEYKLVSSSNTFIQQNLTVFNMVLLVFLVELKSSLESE